MTKRKGRTPPLRPAEYLSYYKYGIQPGGQNADPSIGFSRVPVWDERTSDEHVHRGVDHKMASGHAPSGKMAPNSLRNTTYQQLRDSGDRANMDDSVTVRVGEADTAVDIPIYRDRLSAVSPYFRGAFEGSFKEATDRNLSLTDVSEQTFRIFLQ
ncbi:unnamed protein product [Alternaria alternata]